MRPLFRLNETARRHADVVRWLEDRKGPLGTYAQQAIELLRNCGEDVEEVLHDGHPTMCVDGAAFAYVDLFTAHVNVGFFQGAELPDSAEFLEGTGKYMRHVKIGPDDEANWSALRALIEAAYGDVKSRLDDEARA